jgi:hypothetical protein
MVGRFGACPADAGILVGMRLIAVREEHDDPHLQRLIRTHWRMGRNWPVNRASHELRLLALRISTEKSPRVYLTDASRLVVTAPVKED